MNRNINIKEPFIVLQLLTSIFLITLGIQGLLEYNSEWNQFVRGLHRIFGGNGKNILSVVFSILELASGAVVLLALFRIGQGKLVRILTIIVVLFWLFRIILYYFFNGFLEPNIIIWLNRLCLDLIISAVLWMISKRYGLRF